MIKKGILFILILVPVCITIAMKEGKEDKSIKYVALGDSYTIGEGAKSGEAFPDLLTKHLKENGVDITLSANPSVTGWTTEDLIEKELPVFDRIKPDFVTILIGVNDWVQGIDSGTFHKTLTYIIDYVQAKMPDKSKVLLITIPDFGVTPTGKMYSGGRDISQGITDFNNIIKSEAHKRNLPVADIFAETQKMKDSSDLIAHDGLHPSAKEYALWETIIYPVAYKLLKG
jgi:lysophospholipase L1-like esterase